MLRPQPFNFLLISALSYDCKAHQSNLTHDHYSKLYFTLIKAAAVLIVFLVLCLFVFPSLFTELRETISHQRCL